MSELSKVGVKQKMRLTTEIKNIVNPRICLKSKTSWTLEQIVYANDLPD